MNKTKSAPKNDKSSRRAPATADEKRQTFAAMSTAELTSTLKEKLDATADSILDLGLLVHELEVNRRIDLSYLDIPIIDDLRMIGSGKLSHEAWFRFSDRKYLYEKIAAMPVEEQEKLAAGVPVKVVENNRVKEVDPRDLSQEKISQVFGKEGPRTVAEQKERIEKIETPIYERQKTNPVRCSWNFKEDGLTIERGTGTIPRDELIGKLGLAQDHIVRLSKAQEKLLERKAADAGVSTEEFIREAIRVALA